MAGDTSKKGFFRKFLRKLGEPPVLLSSLNLEKNVQILQNHIENAGYFRGRTRGDTLIRKKTAKAIYRVGTGSQYTINEVKFVSMIQPAPQKIFSSISR
jgi:outer membrane protein assembly factor BamA